MVVQTEETEYKKPPSVKQHDGSKEESKESRAVDLLPVLCLLNIC